MAISSSGAVTSTGAIGGSNATTLATTGSNTFTGQQYVSNTNAPVNFTDTASLYTDGGLRVGKDAYVSGTLYLNNLTVYGTQSVNYITSSQLDIADNIITVNTSTPAIRFGGIAVRDSGSLGTGLTGSLLWDSQNNHWIYSNPSGSSYSGGMFISGPRNTGSMGDEQGTTFNALMKGQGGDHITSSGIFESGSNVGIGTSTPTTKFDLAGTIGNFQIASSGAEIFLTRNENNDILATGGTSSGITIGAQSYVRFSVGTSYTERMRITSGGNVGIGTSSPAHKLDVSGDRIKVKSSGSYGGVLADNTGGTGGGFFGAYKNGVATGYFGTSGAILGDTSEDIILYGDGSAGIRMYTANIERMRITSGGNIGLATTSPAALLTLKGRGGADIIFQMNDESNVRRCFYIPNQYYGYMWAVGVVSNNGKAFSFGNQDGTEVGSIQITATGVNYTSNSSDIRKKKNFENWEESVLPYFKHINPQKFNYTIEEDGESKTKGFIAQEMYDKFPEAYPLDLDGFHSFNPGGMVVYLMKAIQELKAENDTLKEILQRNNIQ
jgi:hypothetical protein